MVGTPPKTCVPLGRDTEAVDRHLTFLPRNSGKRKAKQSTEQRRAKEKCVLRLEGVFVARGPGSIPIYLSKVRLGAAVFVFGCCGLCPLIFFCLFFLFVLFPLMFLVWFGFGSFCFFFSSGKWEKRSLTSLELPPRFRVQMSWNLRGIFFFAVLQQ